MTGTVIIASAAYVGAELSAELGQLPPAFLPVASGRLYEKQIGSLASRFDRIVLTLPSDFALPEADAAWLSANDVEVITVDPKIDLCHSLLHVIDDLDFRDGEVAVLHGDTLFPEAVFPDPDAFFVSETRHAYRWAQCDVQDGLVAHVASESQAIAHSDTVLSGFFHFSDVRELALSLAVSAGFAEALDHYAQRVSVHAVTPPVWLDFGHSNSFYTSRASFTTQRSFNDLTIQSGVVWKSSQRPGRVDAEANWFESVPFDVKALTPQFLGRWTNDGADGYRLKYAHMPSLAELFVFADLPDYAWSHIVEACGEFLRLARSASQPLTPVPSDYASMHRRKTLARLAEWSTESGTSLETPWRFNGRDLPGLDDIANRLADIVEGGAEEATTIVHGDFCFSNILYDFRSDTVCVLDPRGQDADDRTTIWGDQRYDAAKLMHSANGLYDLIIAGRMLATQPAPHELLMDANASHVQQIVGNRVEQLVASLFPGELRVIQAMTALLFLSMLPLHDDRPARQRTMLANGLRLYTEVMDEDA
ncbi:phosphotransferase [Microbacterium gorillae]|uniref:phosphotransferase n=1 Tax=Microbacterium gorillae TaxID=1231063 RepID=UPI00058F631C|nr:phosphotransferase [Microbacterium gorillae]